MKKIRSIFFLSMLFVCVKPPIFSHNSTECIEMGKKVYYYAYPLVLVELTKRIMISGISSKDPMKPRGALNHLTHISIFPDDAFKTIVRPNIDTLYSFAWIDLEQEPVIFSMPDTQGRYYVAEIMDAWTNVFASLGKRTLGTCASEVVFVGPQWKEELPQKMKKIKAPTNVIWLLLRIQTNGKKDYNKVQGLQKGFSIIPLSTWLHKKTIKPSTQSAIRIDPDVAPVEQLNTMDANTFLSLFAEALKKNPPLADDKAMLPLLVHFGIIPGRYFDPKLVSQDSLNCMQKAMQQVRTEMFEKSKTLGTLSNGWMMLYDLGSYGTDYIKRAVVAYIGIGANLAQDALYPTAFVDKDGNQLNGKNNYILHFDKNEIPPVNAFWSVTLYNDKSFLVKNNLKRYGLGDRDPLKFNKDGSLDIYIQHENPGKEKEANWLPAPLHNFSLTMRLYWPKNEVLHKWWLPPAIKKKDERSL